MRMCTSMYVGYRGVSDWVQWYIPNTYTEDEYLYNVIKPPILALYYVTSRPYNRF